MSPHRNPTHIMAAIPHPEPLDVDDVLQRIDDAVHAHAFLDRHGAPRRILDVPLSIAERARWVGTNLSRRTS